APQPGVHRVYNLGYGTGFSVQQVVDAARVVTGHPVRVLVGERRGLSSADSLGVYLTWDPRPGRADSERNCVSNVRPPHGLSYAQAADTVAALLAAARELGASGVALKDEGPALPAAGG
ncbi:ethanolamine ammonia-lyase light chain EutC, partial [Geodermatophilus nigrescens]